MRLSRMSISQCASTLLILGLAAVPGAAQEGSWSRTGPDSGDVVEIAAAPSRPGVIYLGLRRGGVFRSADRGRTWTFAGAGLIQLAILDLDVDPADPSRVYAATAEGLFRSTDGGASWLRTGTAELTGPYGGNVTQVEIHPRRPSLVLAAVPGGPLFRSTDRGRTWTAVPGGPEGVAFLAASPARPGLFWASLLSGGLFKSTDGGRTWTAASGLPAGGGRGLAVDPRAAGTVYAVVDSPPDSVFKSTDGGATWRPSSEGLRGASVSDLAVDPGRPATLYAVASGMLFRSRNGGAAWTQLATPGMQGGPQTVKPLGDGVLAGTWTGLFLSRDQGATWRASRTGLTAGAIAGLALDSQNPPRMYAVDSLTGLYKSRDRGASWLHLTDASAPPIYSAWVGPVAVDPVDPETVYAGVPLGLPKSGNGGRRWTMHPVSSCFRPLRIGIDPRSPSTLYASDGFLSSRCAFSPDACVLHRSQDAGETWTCIRHGLPVPAGGALLGIDPFTSAVYAGNYPEVWRSRDQGDTWTLVTAEVDPSTFTPSPVEEGTLWAGGQGEVGWSRDGGQTWTFSSTGLPADGVIDLAFDPTDPAVLYAATHVHGVFRSIDAGASWAPLGTWPAGVSLETGIELDPQNASVVYAATYEAGVLRYEP